MGLAEDVLERFLELGVDGHQFLLAVLTVGVVPVRTHAHRAGSVQGEGGHDVVEAGGLHPLEQLAHATGVELEHAEGVASGEQVVRRLVVGGQRVEVDFLAAVELDVLQAVTDHGEVS